MCMHMKLPSGSSLCEPENFLLGATPRVLGFGGVYPYQANLPEAVHHPGDRDQRPAVVLMARLGPVCLLAHRGRSRAARRQKREER